MGSYIPVTCAGRKKMLEAVGLSSLDELYKDVPEEALLKELNLPEGLSEMEVSAKISAMADRNVRFKSIFRGAGAYRHYIPSIVKSVTSKEEFLTAYTPYQAEISQGVLQSIFEYQTQICELTGMDVSNASVYDGAVAAAEAVFMCEERKRSGVIVSGAANPRVIEVIKTYCASRNVPVAVLPVIDYATDVNLLKSLLGGEKTLSQSDGNQNVTKNMVGAGNQIFFQKNTNADEDNQALSDLENKLTACKSTHAESDRMHYASVYIQSPNYFGVIEDVAKVSDAAHEAGVKLIMGFNPISLGLLKSPAELGADIAVAEGQPLGLPLSFGGPYLGIMACKSALIRKLPGRIVGETADSSGRRAFVLTLQAREQHIRREKATSNICSNEALCAMTASVYLAAMGPKGLRQAAELSAAHAHYLAEELSKIPGFTLKTNRPFFNEFVTACPTDAEELCAELEKVGILGGLPLYVSREVVSDDNYAGGSSALVLNEVNGDFELDEKTDDADCAESFGSEILWCCTELNGKDDIDRLIAAL